jgi:hypothetical protein
MTDFLFRTSAGLCLLALVAGMSPPAASAQRAAVAARAGTPGIGWEFLVEVSGHIHVRTGASYFTYNRTDETTGEDLDLDVESNARLFSLAALVDLYPWTRGGVRLSGGVLYNGNLGDVSATAVAPYQIGERTFTPEEIGTLDGELSFSTLAPYLGIGFGNLASPKRRVGVALDLGVIYHRRPVVKLGGSGLVAPTAEQAPQVEDNLSSFRFFPVLSIGIGYRFGR